MHSETFIPVNLEPGSGVNPHPVQPPDSNRNPDSYVRNLTGNLTVILCITARTGEPGFACAVTLHEATAIILHKLTPRGGGK
jgi:hypothetical protein